MQHEYQHLVENHDILSRYVINEDLNNGMQIEGVELGVIICPVPSPVFKPQTKVHEALKLPISTALGESSHDYTVC